ncbi:hypothetical protein CDD83_8042 [Cordyceps sp. RAO-2017]|nr:hypothetical protein CDD83_8042 [Cordyceps sp. RAO-2017]
MPWNHDPQRKSNGKFELIEADSSRQFFGRNSQPAAGLAVSVGAAPAEEPYRGGPGIMRTVDICQREYNARDSADRLV